MNTQDFSALLWSLLVLVSIGGGVYFYKNKADVLEINHVTDIYINSEQDNIVEEEIDSIESSLPSEICSWKTEGHSISVLSKKNTGSRGVSEVEIIIKNNNGDLIKNIPFSGYFCPKFSNNEIIYFESARYESEGVLFSLDLGSKDLILQDLQIGSFGMLTPDKSSYIYIGDTSLNDGLKVCASPAHSGLSSQSAIWRMDVATSKKSLLVEDKNKSFTLDEISNGELKYTESLINEDKLSYGNCPTLEDSKSNILDLSI